MNPKTYRKRPKTRATAPKSKELRLVMLAESNEMAALDDLVEVGPDPDCEEVGVAMVERVVAFVTFVTALAVACAVRGFTVG